MTDENQADSIIHAIKLTQKLRASVNKVFDTLADGFSIEQNNEKTLLNNFQKGLLDVNSDYSELEKVGTSLPPLSSLTPNSIYLSIDPAIDKSPVYSKVLKTYKWSNKVSELAGYAAAILDQHVKIKRTQPLGGTLQAKKLRRALPLGHSVPPNSVDLLIAKLNQKASDMSITLTRPLGSYAILQISLGRILKAQVALRGLMIEWVNIRGFNEDNPDESKLELWAKSRYEVFQKVTESATAATLHFYSPHNAELSLTSFLHWFQRYKTLFSAPCTKCGKHYLNGLPPTWRDLRATEPYHDVCRQ